MIKFMANSVKNVPVISATIAERNVNENATINSFFKHLLRHSLTVY